MAMAACGDSRRGCLAGKSPAGAAKADASLGKLLTTKSVLLGGMIFAFQQFAGINAIIYFSSSVFAQVRSSHSHVAVRQDALALYGRAHEKNVHCAYNYVCGNKRRPLPRLLRTGTQEPYSFCWHRPQCSTAHEQCWNRACMSVMWSCMSVQAGVKSQALASAGVGAINVLGTIVAGSLVDKAGRKQLLLVSFLGMAASMLAMSAGLGLPSLQVLTGSCVLGSGPQVVRLPRELSSRGV